MNVWMMMLDVTSNFKFIGYRSMVVEQIAILTLLGEAEPSKRFHMNKFDIRMMDLLHWNEVEINCIDNAGKENAIW